MSPDDVALLGRLSTVFERSDPVPDAVGAAAERAGRWVGRAGSWSSLTPVADDRGLRGGSALLAVTGPAGRVDVEIGDDGHGSVRLTGLFRQPEGSECALWVRWPDGERRVDVDGFGRFTQGGLPAGPLSVVVRRSGAPDAVSPWFVG